MTPNQELPTTRERILAYLEENRTATALALSRAWGLTRANIRYHLNELIDEGSVEVVPKPRGATGGRGRPTIYYRLSSNSAPDNLSALCGALLDVINEANLGTNILESVAEKLSPETLPSGPITLRLSQTINLLNQHGYRARWEAHAKGPRILLRNCPYALIIEGRPQVCVLDRRMLERLVQVPLIHSTRMNIQTGAPSACVFSLMLDQSPPVNFRDTHALPVENQP